MDLQTTPRDHSQYELSQWEKTLLCNVFSHWLSPYLQWSLIPPSVTYPGDMTTNNSSNTTIFIPVLTNLVAAGSWSECNLPGVIIPSRFTAICHANWKTVEVCEILQGIPISFLIMDTLITEQMATFFLTIFWNVFFILNFSFFDWISLKSLS